MSCASSPAIAATGVAPPAPAPEPSVRAAVPCVWIASRAAVRAAPSPSAAAPPAPALVVEAPRRATSALLAELAPVLFDAPRRRLYAVDGANVFDPYAFSRAARAHGLRDAELMERLFVTRAFTIHQLAAVTAGMLPPLVAPPRAPAPSEGAENAEEGGDADADDDATPPPVLAVLGLDHLFLEETLRVAERRRVLRGVMDDLARLRRAGARLLVTHAPLPAEGGGAAAPAAWWRPLRAFGDVRCRALPDGAGGWWLDPETTTHGTNPADLQHLAPGRDRLVAELPPGAAR